MLSYYKIDNSKVEYNLLPDFIQNCFNLNIGLLL